MLKLRIYNRPGDPHAYMEVLGEVATIFELYLILGQRTPNIASKVGRLRVFNLNGAELDTKQPLAEWHANCSLLSYGQT